jgi:transcriptional regulator with XRE-family HTH domain
MSDARNTPAALAEEIRRMRAQGFSVREIARRTGLGKTFVHDVARGKRSLSVTRATAASEELARHGGMLILAAGQDYRKVNPLTKRDYSKIGRYWNAVQRARHRNDFTRLEQSLGKSGTTVKTAEGTFQLETDPYALATLDDIGLLQPEEILVGESA